MEPLNMDVETWNNTCAVRQAVIYRRDSGGDIHTYTRSTAFHLLGTGSGPKVFIEDADYPVSLDRVRPA
jgi:hypothetical protein